MRITAFISHIAFMHAPNYRHPEVDQFSLCFRRFPSFTNWRFVLLQHSLHVFYTINSYLTLFWRPVCFQHSLRAPSFLVLRVFF